MVDRKKLAEKGIDIKWRYRYKKVLSNKTKGLIYNFLIESFKVRNVTEDVLKNEPIYHKGYDDDGVFFVYHPKPNDGYDKIRELSEVSSIQDKLNEITKLQNDLRKVPVLSLKELKSIEEQIDVLFKEVFGNFDDAEIKNDDEYENDKGKAWFELGVKFATGEVHRLYYEEKLSGTQIAKRLGKPGNGNLITETLGDNDSLKNIYNNEKKMKKIYRYCQDNSITIDNSFKTALNRFKPI